MVPAPACAVQTSRRSVESMTEALSLHLARWCRALEWAAVPERARDAVRWAIADTMAVTVAGWDEPVAVSARNIEAGGGPLTPARSLGTAAHALDFDDTCFAGIVHGSAVIVPACLAAAAINGADGESLARAILAGSEVCYALGDAMGPGLYHSGWLPTSILGGIGAAAGAGVVLGLGETELASAIGLAAVQAFGTRAVAGSSAKPYLVGRAAAVGLEAALAARAGITAPVEALEGRAGLFAQFGADNTVDPDLARRLGDPWRVVDPGLVIKAYPLCSCAQAAVDGVLDCLAELQTRPEDIASIDCHVTPMVGDAMRFDRPQNRAETMFSLPFALALTALEGTVRPESLRPERCGEPDFSRLLDCIHWKTDLAIVADLEAYPEAARVMVRLNDGRNARHVVPVARGDPRHPMDKTAFLAKLTACLGADATRLLALCEKIEEQADLAALMAFLSETH